MGGSKWLGFAYAAGQQTRNSSALDVLHSPGTHNERARCSFGSTGLREGRGHQFPSRRRAQSVLLLTRAYGF